MGCLAVYTREKQKLRRIIVACRKEEQATIIHENQTTVQADPLRVNAVGGELVPLQAPLKPGSELRVPPGGMDPLYETLVTVTELPDCVYVPFQSCVIVCPLGNENWRFQPLMAPVPVFLIVKLAPKPVFHWLVIA